MSSDVETNHSGKARVNCEALRIKSDLNKLIDEKSRSKQKSYELKSKVSECLKFLTSLAEQLDR